MSEPPGESFPCEFALKVIGRSRAELHAAASTIIERHMGPLAPGQLSERASRDGNFVALTYTVHAHSRTQLDAVYRELSACEAVLMAL